jgi:5-methyltetrahydropteroyltriglutamate--homocysteine methyltransferase
MLLPTTVVGSYPQPEWLLDREALGGRLPPRVRAQELWRVSAEFLEQAQDDATVVAIREMERAGIDIITDGEQRRESYSNRFATSLDGVDIENPGSALDRTGHPNPVPRVTGPVRRVRAGEVADLEFLKRSTDRTVKMTLPGPFTMAQQAQNDHYAADEAMIMDYAAAVNDEVLALFATGATWSSSMSRTCRRGPRRRGSTRCARWTVRCEAHQARPPSTSALTTRAWSKQSPTPTPSWPSSPNRR